MRFGIIGSGSWATALTKILVDRKHTVNWWIRNADTISYMQLHHHNPNYLSAATFDVSLLSMSSDIKQVVQQSDVLIVAVPSAFVEESLAGLTTEDWAGKKVVSAVKGLLPDKNILLNSNVLDYLLPR